MCRSHARVRQVWPEADGDSDLSLVEIATYAEPRLAEQLARDVMLAYLARGIVPDVICLVLRPRGRSRAPRRVDLRSPDRATSCRLAWPVIELWKIPAEDLLAADDVGLIPWVPLSNVPSPPEPVFQQCREIIDGKAPAGEHENLLTVTQILASLRYNDPRLFQILGGQQLMIESPLVKQIVDEATQEARQKTWQEAILQTLADRFGPVPQALVESVRAIGDEARLRSLSRLAACCSTLDEFVSQLN